MKKIATILIALALTGISFGQVGVGTSNPAGALDITSTVSGLVLPRVANTGVVINPSGSTLAVGTLVFDQSKGCIKVVTATGWSNCFFYTESTDITSLDCTGATTTGTLTVNEIASGVSTSIPYTGGNGNSHAGQVVASTGVTGLTATLSAGSFAVGSGALTYTITGTPAGSGTASFAVSIGGQSCSLNISVASCGAYVSAGVYKEFMCHNLGADTSLDPNVPVQGIHGNYYQWGSSTVVADAYTPSGTISGWNTTAAANGSWLDASKTANDPCPVGFRVPTNAQWLGVIANNTVSRTGSWANDGNFTTAIHWGPNASTKTLTLPAAGYRGSAVGTLASRGGNGYSWSSTENGTSASYLWFNSSTASTGNNSRTYGFSVRCVSE